MIHNNHHHIASLSRKCKTLNQLKQIHAHLLKSSSPENPFALAPVLSAAATSGHASFFSYARSIFHHLRHRRNVFMYNSMIRGFVGVRAPLDSVLCYLDMLTHGLAANHYTFPPLMKACTILVAPGSKLVIGRLVHAHVVKFGFREDPFVNSTLIEFYSSVYEMELARFLFDNCPKKDVVLWTTMIDGYGRMGDVEKARELFDEMPERNAVSWSAMMAAYSRLNNFKEVLCLFGKMQEAAIRPNESVLVTVLTASARLGAVTQGLWIHSYAKRNKLSSNRILATALVDLYSKCGLLESALAVFEGISSKDAEAWNAMITGLSLNGNARKSLDFFEKMTVDGIQPTETTFIAVLTACTHAQMVNEGLKLFNEMSTIYGVKPQGEHYACVVDLLARAGMVEEAEKFLDENETAGDETQMSVQVKLVGTQFGVASPSVPLPTNISLVNDGFVCPKPTMQGKNEMQVCCTVDKDFKSNVTVDDEFLPRQNGDLTIMYDVIRTYDSNYWAQVTMENHNPLGRLDNWKLSWDWMKDEFIYTMKGAYPTVLDSSDCVFGVQGQHYKDLDFSTVFNCERRPTIIDLPLTKYNDSILGFKPYCCRNGTILPPQMDASKSISSFQLQVFKMPPDVNRSELSPPQNWRINGTLNPDYKCGPPARVSASQFPDPSGLPTNTTAVASWQVVCNITVPKDSSPRCCVSFSAYYNESVIPCNTCACGCSRTTDRTCSTSAQAMLLPPEVLLVPFENRTAKAIAWAQLKHLPNPNPMPCSDNCGVSINWHLATDYNKGWSARITLFNWDETTFPDWFAAVQMKKAVPGYQKMYSFNGTTLELNGVNNTLFMQGNEGLNYLVAETDALNPERDPRIPGKQQSVISFTKKLTPGIKVAAGEGFPTKVFFNGEECSLPKVFPTSDQRRNSVTISSVLMLVLVLILI